MSPLTSAAGDPEAFRGMSLMPFWRGRLSYAAFLAHPMVLYTVYGDWIHAPHYSATWYAFYQVGVVGSAFLLAIPLHLLVSDKLAARTVSECADACWV
jgi:peptidoglycan/LPS O-acetylase OafA/YrhL